jgi:mannose-6-phosphate isomerase
VVPERLPANQPPARFYAGGRRIAELRGTGDGTQLDAHVPEDWVASATTLFGEADLGLTRLADGGLLRDALAADPVGWLGADHVAAFGSDPGLLVKLLDAGQRLPVHAHPDVPFAREHLGLAHGKTEAWIVIEPADVHLGFTREVSADELAAWVDAQDVDAMLGAMHLLRLEPGDAVLVPAGMPHAIGEGAFVVELQEPTDLSILLEWTGFDIDGRELGHLGLGFPTALAAVDRRAWARSEVEGLRAGGDNVTGDLLPAAAPFFRVERSRGPAAWDAGYAVVVVLSGSGTLVTADGTVELDRGATVVVPHGAGACRIEGSSDLEVLRCRPPRPVRGGPTAV